MKAHLVLVTLTALGACTGSDTNRPVSPPVDRMLRDSGIVAGAAANPIPGSIRAKAEAVRNSPAFVAMRARQDRVTARGALLVVIPDNGQDPAILATVRLGQAGDLSRYVEISPNDINSVPLQVARGAAFAYEMQHEDDVGPVTITIYRNGRKRIQSDKHGESQELSASPDLPRENLESTKRIRDALANAKTQMVHGLGKARVVAY